MNNLDKENVKKYLKENQPKEYVKIWYKYLGNKKMNPVKKYFILFEILIFISAIIFNECNFISLAITLILIYTILLLFVVVWWFLSIKANNLRFKRAANFLKLDFKEVKKEFKEYV